MSSLSLRLDKMFEYVVASTLRECGYIAGVPFKRLGGRGTTHQIDVLGIEFKQLPFLYDTVLVVEAKCYDRQASVGIDTVRRVKSILIDLEQTLPRKVRLLPRYVAPLHYFKYVFGNSEGENLTVSYKGAIFSTKSYSEEAQAFANAHGIFLFNFPEYIAGKSFLKWMKMLLDELSNLAENPINLHEYLPRSLSIEATTIMLEKLKKSYKHLEPKERHSLFTLIRKILEKKEEFRGFWSEIREYCVAVVNGYPVLTQLNGKKPVYILTSVLEQYMTRRNVVKLGGRFKTSDMVVKKEYSERLNSGCYEVGYSILFPKDRVFLSGKIFIPSFLNELLEKKRIVFVLPLREGINLIARSSKRSGDRASSFDLY